MSPKQLTALAALLRTTYTMSRPDREALAVVCEEAAKADERVRTAVDAERQRCAKLCFERRIHFASEEAADSFAGLLLNGKA